MEIDCHVLGDFETNCYVVREAPEATDCLVIDPGLSAEPLVDSLQDRGYRPVRILLTHGHVDHIAGIPLLRNAFGPVPVGLGADEADLLNSSTGNLSLMLGRPLKIDGPIEHYRPGEKVKLGAIELEVLFTPGHTRGGISYYAASDKVVFTGDTLFNGAVGRTDFPGGSAGTLLASIREQLLVLPGDCRVYCGHGPATTIDEEKRHNPFLR